MLGDHILCRQHNDARGSDKGRIPAQGPHCLSAVIPLWIRFFRTGTHAIIRGWRMVVLNHVAGPEKRVLEDAGPLKSPLAIFSQQIGLISHLYLQLLRIRWGRCCLSTEMMGKPLVAY